MIIEIVYQLILSALVVFKKIKTMNINPLLYTDGYKVDHRRQYPHATTLVYSNWTPRKSRVKGVEEVVFFGLQYFIKRYMLEGARF